MANGMRKNLYQQYDVLIVHILQLSSSNYTCQNTDVASKVEKYLAPDIRGTTSSKVGMW